MRLNALATQLLSNAIGELAEPRAEVTSLSMGEREGRMALIVEWRISEAPPSQPPPPPPYTPGPPPPDCCPRCQSRELAHTNDGVHCADCGGSFEPREDDG